MPIQPKQQPPYYKSTQPPKVYIALITQTGTNDPTVEILKNTYPETPEWTYSNIGTYILTAVNPIFEENKTTIEITPSFTDLWTVGTRQSENLMRLETYAGNGDGTSSLSNGALLNTTITITTY